ncbi:phosphonate ABC transporter ATP-binding protein [Halobellus captivus]|uniref:phosphonate ABC transporter ATP-binding protein n=1 Tax=Halobellus captivus TaxID=2592614 RepID=UPI00119F3A6D|nr:phosphonate ABC transporter ATP-binding protein [Halobellus captivus]
MLSVTDLQKTYPSGDEALKGVSLEVTGSETVAMIGPSGAGKSTFIRCVNRLTEPSGGSVELDGLELTGLSGKKLRNARRDIGMIFQEYNLIERLTVMENVLSGRLGYVSTWNAFRRNFDGDDIERAYEVLERVGLDGHENNRADELSGGQRQRVGIARAILQRPKILLVDEPTSSLDPESSRAVMDLLTEIAAEDDIPVLINIHEVDLAEEYADRIVGLRLGEKVFEGTPADLDETARGQIYRGEEIPEGAGPTGKVAAEAGDVGGVSSDEGEIRRS